MTHRERVLRTFRFEETDRIAYDLMEGDVWSELLSYFREQHGLQSPTQVWDFLDVDCRWVLQFVRPPDTSPPTPGAPAAPRTVFTRQVAHGPLSGATTLAEVEAYPLPDPDWSPIPDFAAARAQWPDHALVYCPTFTLALFWNACDAFGMEAGLIKMHTEPHLFEALVKREHERGMEILRRTLPHARGICDICWMGDDFAGQQALLMQPELWRRLIKPYLAEQVALVRSHDLPVLFHSCGAVREVLPDLIDIGVNAMLVFQTSAAGMDPESIARDFGGRMAFYGGMDVQYLLSRGTVAEVEAAVARNVRAFADCGGYMVANSHCSIATVRGENIEAMCAAARRTPDPRSRR